MNLTGIRGNKFYWEYSGPYLTDNTGKPIIPEIENGYYLLIDKQENQVKIVSNYDFPYLK